MRSTHRAQEPLGDDTHDSISHRRTPLTDQSQPSQPKVDVKGDQSVDGDGLALSPRDLRGADDLSPPHTISSDDEELPDINFVNMDGKKSKKPLTSFQDFKVRGGRVGTLRVYSCEPNDFQFLSFSPGPPQEWEDEVPIEEPGDELEPANDPVQ